jgi:hypothetical protein
MLTVSLCCGERVAATDPHDPFLPYLSGKPPVIVSKLATEIVGTVRLERVVFLSRLVPTKKGTEPSKVFAVIASPLKQGKYPGLLVLHGGRGAAEEKKAIAWATRGYVVVAPDLPGIAAPELIPNSSGPWKGSFTTKYISANPDVTASPTFDGVLAAIQALDWLRDRADVRVERIGVVGIAWGGYVATMVRVSREIGAGDVLGIRLRLLRSRFGLGNVGAIAEGKKRPHGSISGCWS